MKKSISLLVVLVLFASFSRVEKNYKNADWLPDDFDTRNSVFLVENISGPGNARAQKVWEKVNLEIQAIMKKEYLYKYEFITGDIESNSKYADKTKYRYLMVHEYEYGSALGGSGTNWAHDYHIYDRKEKKNYPNTSPSNSPQLVFKNSIIAIVNHLKELK
jgi:hypothetical protein